MTRVAIGGVVLGLCVLAAVAQLVAALVLFGCALWLRGRR